MSQLSLDGSESTPKDVSAQRAPFSAAQREILRYIATHGWISSLEAGTIIHAHRAYRCRRCREGTCPYRSSDGSDAMKRLMKRGMVKRRAPKGWEAA